MKLTKTDIYAILATICLIVALWHIRYNDSEYQRLTEELNDYQLERGQIMLELEALKTKRDSIIALYERGKAATPDIGKAQDIIESVYISERDHVVRLSPDGTIERMAWIDKADSLLNKDTK